MLLLGLMEQDSRKVLVHQEENIKVYIYTVDHGPPHVHVKTSEGEFRYLIRTFQVVGKRRPPESLHSLIQGWGLENQQSLLQSWDEIVVRRDISKPPMAKRQKRVRRRKRKR